MHFHFIVRREISFSLSCMFRHTLVPMCHKWLFLVGVILSVPGGRAEFTRWSCTHHGCKLNATMGWSRLRGTCLPVIFRHWVYLQQVCCSYSQIRRVALLLPLAATLYRLVSPVEKQPMPPWHMLSTGLGFVFSPSLYSCFHKAAWHLQLCWQRNVLKMSVRKCEKAENIQPAVQQSITPSLRRPHGLHSPIDIGNDSFYFQPKGP